MNDFVENAPAFFVHVAADGPDQRVCEQQLSAVDDAFDLAHVQFAVLVRLGPHDLRIDDVQQRVAIIVFTRHDVLPALPPHAEQRRVYHVVVNLFDSLQESVLEQGGRQLGLLVEEEEFGPEGLRVHLHHATARNSRRRSLTQVVDFEKDREELSHVDDFRVRQAQFLRVV